MRFEILGPLRVHAGGAEITIGSGRERTLLALLLLHANRTVPINQLVEAIWAEQPPPGARNQLQGCVSRLRKRLATTGLVIITEPAGYRATVAPDDLDLLEFRRLVGKARTATAAGDHADAVAAYRAALAQWRGPALGGAEGGPAHAAVALDEEHVQVQEECIEAELAAGGAGQLVPELTELVGQHPHRERLHRALMLALYRAGRQADALAAYRHARTILHDELGIEPGTELQRLHQAILNRDPDLDPPAATPTMTGRPPTPRELPADVTGFTGRTDALKTLDQLLTDNPHGSPTPVVISAIAGTAGVGKTALAVHWAHQVADRFPHGQLYLNLRGYATTTPVRPIEALSALLRSLGTPPEQIPTDEAQAAALYRTQLADRRMLIVLDNARSVDQIRPLLPGSPGCLVLVTSRDRLTGLVARDGATRLTLDVLTPDEAQALLTNLLGADRVDAEAAAVIELAELCARLPLALRIAAELAASRPTTSLAGLVSDLSDSQRRLEFLDSDGDPLATVKTVFSWSIRHLPPEAAQVFGWLGLHPGPEFDPYAAAALAGTTDAHARRSLDLLARAHLVHLTNPDRYSMHDLLRAYATHLTTEEHSDGERCAAVSRLFDYYLATASEATNCLYPAEATRRPQIPAPTTPAPGLVEPEAARAWLDAERATLVAATAHAEARGWPTYAILLASTLYRYLDGGHYVDALSVHNHAQVAAQRIDDPAGQAYAHRSLGVTFGRIGRFGSATDHLHQALRLFRSVGDPSGEAMALNSLGAVEWRSGHFDQALEHDQQALELFRRIGDRTGESGTLNSIGIVEKELGRYASAADHHLLALAVCQDLKDPYGMATALNCLGGVDERLGRYKKAADYYGRSLTLFRELGNLQGEAAALTNLGMVHSYLGQPDQATEHQKQALTLFRETGDRVGEIWALNGLGEAANGAEKPADAIAHHTAALNLVNEGSAPGQEARAHVGIGDSYKILDDMTRAGAHYNYALHLHTDIDSPDAKKVRTRLASLPRSIIDG